MERNREDAIWNENAFLVALTLSRFVYVEISIAEEFEKNSFALAKKKKCQIACDRGILYGLITQKEREKAVDATMLSCLTILAESTAQFLASVILRCRIPRYFFEGNKILILLRFMETL